MHLYIHVICFNLIPSICTFLPFDPLHMRGDYGSLFVCLYPSITITVGSVLLVYAGEGGDDGCFIQLSEDSTISGFTVYYPSQDPKQVPKPYPWYVMQCHY